MNAGVRVSGSYVSAWSHATKPEVSTTKRPLSPSQYPQTSMCKRARRPELQVNCAVQYRTQPVLMTHPSPSPLQLSPLVAGLSASGLPRGHPTSTHDLTASAQQTLGAANWAQYSENLETQWADANSSYYIDPRVLTTYNNDVQSAHSLFSSISSGLSMFTGNTKPLGDFEVRSSGNLHSQPSSLPYTSESAKDEFISRAIETLTKMQQALTSLLETVQPSFLHQGNRDPSHL